MKKLAAISPRFLVSHSALIAFMFLTVGSANAANLGVDSMPGSDLPISAGGKHAIIVGGGQTVNIPGGGLALPTGDVRVLNHLSVGDGGKIQDDALPNLVVVNRRDDAIGLNGQIVIRNVGAGYSHINTNVTNPNAMGGISMSVGYWGDPAVTNRGSFVYNHGARDFEFWTMSGGWSPKFFIKDNGRIGVLTANPAYAIDVAGEVRAVSFFHGSDARLKTDVKPIEQALDKVLAIKGVEFKWKKDNRTDVGVVAQNVAEVFPQIVHKDSEGMMSVEYDSLIGPVIEAIRELKKENDALRSKVETIDSLKAQLDDLRASLKEKATVKP